MQAACLEELELKVAGRWWGWFVDQPWPVPYQARRFPRVQPSYYTQCNVFHNTTWWNKVQSWYLILLWQLTVLGMMRYHDSDSTLYYNGWNCRISAADHVGWRRIFISNNFKLTSNPSESDVLSQAYYLAQRKTGPNAPRTGADSDPINIHSQFIYPLSDLFLPYNVVRKIVLFIQW